MSRFDSITCLRSIALLGLGLSIITSLCPTSSTAATPNKVELSAPSPSTGLPRQRKTFRTVGGKRVISKIESDFNGDGLMDFLQTYSDDGNWVTEEASDLNADGSWDTISKYKKSSGRKEPLLATEEYDTNYDGQTDLWKEYDDNGSLKLRSLDRRLSGKPDYWEYYSNGQIVRITQDQDGDGKADQVPTPRIQRR